MRDDLIERLRRQPTVSQYANAGALFAALIAEREEAAAALEAALKDAANSLGALRVAVIVLASAAKGSPAYLPAYNHIRAAIDQARGKGVADEAE